MKHFDDGYILVTAVGYHLMGGNLYFIINHFCKKTFQNNTEFSCLGLNSTVLILYNYLMTIVKANLTESFNWLLAIQ